MSFKFFPILGSCYLLLLALSIAGISADSISLTNSSLVFVSNISSLNWSGYVISSTRGSVSDVAGSWLVPTVSCSSGEYSASSFWVGIDGLQSETVEQIGTISECINGTPVYLVFYEFVPKAARVVTRMSIHPGNVISAEVKFDGRFTLSLADLTTGESFTKSVKDSLQDRSSAEWIAEAPSSSSLGILPLSDFGAVFYGHLFTAVAGTNSATVNGTSGSIGSFGSSVQRITMLTFSGLVKAQPTPLYTTLSPDGMSFTVLWFRYGP